MENTTITFREGIAYEHYRSFAPNEEKKFDNTTMALVEEKKPVEEKKIEVSNTTLVVASKHLPDTATKIVSGTDYIPLFVITGIVIAGVVVGIILTRKILKEGES